MKCVVAGGAGFLGRWVVVELLSRGHEVVVFDDLSTGRTENLRELEGHPGYRGLVVGDVADGDAVRDVVTSDAEAVFHLATSVHVQGSIDRPRAAFSAVVAGATNVLEACRTAYLRRNGVDPDAPFDHATLSSRLTDRRPVVVCVSTCLVYAAADDRAIAEDHPLRPASPLAAARAASDALATAYADAYGMPVGVVRAFSTYGPFQRSGGEGGVVPTFLKRDIEGRSLLVKGAGHQTRDLLYVEDCARAIVDVAGRAALRGDIINVGTGVDVSISSLAALCATGANRVETIPHDHPQAEVARLRCDPAKARDVLGWAPRVTLADGLAITRRWLDANRWSW